MDRPKPPRTGRTYLSYALFALSAALFIAVAIMWYRDDQQASQTPPPPSTPGANQLINVRDALAAQDLQATFGRGGGRSNDLSVAGQLIEVDGAQLYVFIYPQGVAQREAETDAVHPSDLSILNTRGTPIAQGAPAVYIGSNVIAVLYGGDDNLASKVQRAIEGLP